MKKLFFKSLTPLSLHLIELFNKYDKEDTGETEFIEEVNEIYRKNRSLIMDTDEKYSKALKKRIGIKRMRILETIVKSDEAEEI